MRIMQGDQIGFQKKLQEAVAFAKNNHNCMTREQVEHFFADWELSDEQMKFVYEYLTMEQIEVEDYEPGVTKELFSKDAKKKAAFTREEEVYLKQYGEELPRITCEGEEERMALLQRAADGDDLARSQVIALYLPVVVELAKELHKPEFFIGDLIQEGNVALLLALEQVTEAGDADQKIRSEIVKEITGFMDDMQAQKRQDHAVVGKVNRLKDAIEELSDGEEMDFSVAELSAYLDMSVEEIEDILRLTGEDA
ncbi:MAG: hypothetical protein PUJ62_08490 [Lachnospiraceae bacterium]|nr:hypothetical protein [Lachnospiraceae bacterium]